MIVIKCMWNVKANVIPVITGVTGTTSKPLRQYLSNIPVKHESKELQKTSHIGHRTHTTESAKLKEQNMFTGEITLHVAQIVNKEQL
jgi:uncharacterized protein YycO